MGAASFMSPHFTLAVAFPEFRFERITLSITFSLVIKSALKKHPRGARRGICGGVDCAHTPTYTGPLNNGKNKRAPTSIRGSRHTYSPVGLGQTDYLSCLQVYINIHKSCMGCEAGHCAHLTNQGVDKSCTDAGSHLAHGYREPGRHTLQCWIMA